MGTKFVMTLAGLVGLVIPVFSSALDTPQISVHTFEAAAIGGFASGFLLGFNPKVKTLFCSAMGLWATVFCAKNMCKGGVTDGSVVQAVAEKVGVSKETAQGFAKYVSHEPGHVLLMGTVVVSYGTGVTIGVLSRAFLSPLIWLLA